MRDRLDKQLEKLEKFEDFNWKKLSRVRGGAHEAIVGEWISWWIKIDPKDHMVLNPSSHIERRSADIVFLRRTTGNSYFPFGVAEVENTRKKWKQKLRSLRAYERRLDTLRFILLCVTTTEKNEVDEEEFARLVKHTVNMSKNSKLKWILYRLTYSPWAKETFPIVLKDELYYSRVIRGGFFIIKNGKVVQVPKE